MEKLLIPTRRFRWACNQRGASIVEYLLLNSLVAMALIVSLTQFAEQTSARLQGGIESGFSSCGRSGCGGSTEGTTGDTYGGRRGDRNPDR